MNSMEQRRAWRLDRLVGAASVGIIGFALAGAPASAQTFSSAISDGLTPICTTGMVLTNLDSVCTGLSGAPAGPTSVGIAGTSGSLAPTSTEAEGAVARHLERRRERKNAHTAALIDQVDPTGLSGGSGPDDMEFSLGGLSGFATLTYERADKNTTIFDPGYGSNKYGVTVGADRKFGMVVAGLAFNFSRTNANFTNTAGGLDTDSYGGLVYASLAPVPSAFVDLSAGYARKDFSLDRFISLSKGGTTITSGFATSNTNGNEYRVGANSGYDFHRGRFTFGPRIGLNYVHTDVDAFSETGTTGLEMAFNSSSYDSVVSSAGVQGSAAYSTSFGVLVPQVSFAYLHEFANGQQTLTGHLVQDLNATTLSFENDSPDRNYFGIGAGVVAVLPNGYNAFVSYNGTVGNSLITTHTYSVGLRKEF